VTDVIRLMETARVGDRDAFGHLYEHYRKDVHRFIRSRVHDRDLADDLTADTFTKALRNIGNYTWTGTDPIAWFITIARNLILDHIKSSRARLERLTGDFLAAELQGYFRDDKDPADLVIQLREERARLWRIHQLRIAILRLHSDDQREAMLYRHVDGLSIGETAQRMGRGPDSVKALCFRAIQNLHRGQSYLSRRAS
jgi:RNA polymerase sigma-70 factor, ECF subfamily